MQILSLSFHCRLVCLRVCSVFDGPQKTVVLLSKWVWEFQARVSPCIMCVQYRGARGDILSTVGGGDIVSTVKGYLDYRRKIS